MAASYVFCLLLAILTLAGAATAQDLLTCKQCATSTDCETCSLNNTALNNTGGCFTALQDNTLDGRYEIDYSKGCLNSSITSTLFTASFGDGKYLRFSTVFCTDDECNYNTYPVPNNSTLNGLQCPTCFTNTESSCTAQTVPCTGLEKYCVDASGLLLRSDLQTIHFFAGQGCATESVKSILLPLVFKLPHGNYYIVKLNSAEAPPVPVSPPTYVPTTVRVSGAQTLKSLSFVLLLSSLSWILLVKVVS